ncbi:Imm32 family immunity protein [Desulforamulus aeronauticus]|uniref:Immunity protein 32 n=1 Tax=Desulforamulus aeronauticus DSM 10349 TaxID=1121421 RepID=A0A1M6XEP5_9FIRM|nr:Imm32 family immunity protein [Desulforamulus aeronauticus]SHL04383.1 Immunity protein 32 [Desulforamulus aeronauticus DSM 10349]
MILTVEHDEKQEKIEIFCEKEVIELFLKKLTFLVNNGGHVHLMTPSWAANELKEDKQGTNTVLINHLKVVLKPE